MKEFIRKAIVILVVMLMLINSSFLSIVSIASDNSIPDGENIDEAKINPLYEINLEKYVNYKIGENSGTLLQMDLKTGIEYLDGQEYMPLNATGILLNLPKIENEFPENIEVIGKSTKATNGSDVAKDFQYVYDKNIGEMKIVAVNHEDEDGNIYSEKVDGARDEYTVICYYSANCYNDENVERNLELSGFVQVNVENNIIKNTEITQNYNVTENISGLISADVTTSDIYNGYINSNKQNGTQYKTEYTENMKINVSYKDISDEVKVETNNKFINTKDDEIETDEIVYTGVKVNKQNILDVLGEDGKLQILNKSGEVIGEVNKDTEAQEDGTVEINYENEQTDIIVKTTKPVKLGTIELESRKAIKDTMTDIENNRIKVGNNITCINNVKEINENVEENNIGENKTEENNVKENIIEKEIYNFSNNNIIEIKNSETRIDLSVDKTEWTNSITNEINLKLTLENNASKYDLFENPIIEIKLPNDVEKVVLGKVSLLYENGLSLKNTSVIDVDNSKIIKIELEGKQTGYLLNSMVEGPNILIPVSIVLNKDVENTQTNINLNYSNYNSTSIDYINEGKESKEYSIKLNSIYQVQMAQNEYEQLLELNNQIYYAASANENNDISFDIKATIGSKLLNDNDEVYEDQIIKYTIKLKNNTNDKIGNIDIVGNIPDGTEYATIADDTDYKESDDCYDLYKYVTDDSKKQFNTTIELEAGEENEIFYEVKVSKFNNGEIEKQINSNIYASIGDEKLTEFSITNVVKPAEMSIELKSWRTSGKDNLWVYDVYAYNNLDKDIENVKFEIQLPEQIKFEETTEGFNGKINEDNGKLFISVDKLEANTRNDFTFFARLNETNQNENQYNICSYAIAKGDNTKTYYSNENRLIAYTSAIDVRQSSNKEGEDVRYNDEIEYDFVIRNLSDSNYFYDSIYVNIKDFLDENVEGISAEYETFEQKDDGTFEKKTESCELSEDIEDEETGEKKPNIDIDVEIPTGESIKLKILVRADIVYEKTAISNKIDLVYDNKTISSNVIKNNIIAYNDDIDSNSNTNSGSDSDSDSDIDPSDNNNSGIKPDNNRKYNISGIAWIDKNSDGQLNSNEEKYSNLKVKLFNADTGKIVKDNDNNNFEVETDNNGEYNFSNVEVGNYLVLFEYDNSQYKLSKYKSTNVSENINSDVIEKEVNIDGKISRVAVSDVLKVESSNIEFINIGLVPNQKFDFSLNKTITKVTTIYNGKSNVNNYDFTKLAKIEIPAKQINNTTLEIEYQIDVKNEGDISGYVNEIVDYIPQGLEFDAELNKDWLNSNDGNLRTAIFSGTKIEPGETKSVKLYLTKSLTKDSMGNILNEAEISKCINENGIDDVDSIPGNKNTEEDDYSNVQLIVSIKTGAVAFTLIIIGILIILIIFKVLIDKKIIKISNFKNIKFIMFLCIMVISISTVYNNTNATLESDIEDELKEQYKNTVLHIKYGVGYKHHWESHRVGELYCSDGMNMCGNEDHQYKFTGIKNFRKSKISTEKEGTPVYIKDKTSGKPTITTLNENYSKVGPYKVEFSGDFKIKAVYSNKGQVSDYKVINENGNSTTIKSNVEFYIRIPSSITKITKISVATSGKDTVVSSTKYKISYTEIWKCFNHPTCPGKNGNYHSTQVMNKDIETTKTIKTKSPSSATATLPGTGATIKEGQLNIEKVDSINGDHPLENVGFTFSATIKVYKYKETVDDTKSCTHWNSGYYEHDDDGIDKKTGKKIDCVHWHDGYYSHSSDTWRRNVYEQVETTMYIGSDGQFCDSPYTFYTDEDGDISISSISLPDPLKGTNVEKDGDEKELEAEYVDTTITAHEVSNPYYGYEYNTGSTTFSVQRGSTEKQILTNPQKLVKLSGYVWIDGPEGKETFRNDVYDTGEEDGLNGISVYLVDSGGNRIRETTTGQYTGYSEINNGQYIFTGVDAEKIGSYHIEFEYNGLVYETVDAELSEDNTSKAADTYTRTNLDQQFASIDGNGSQNLYVGNITIGYDSIKSHGSTISSLTNTSVIASTLEAGYNLMSNFDPPMEEIMYINLGLREKEQADYALTKDLYNVTVSVNGRSHVYRYGTKRYDENGEEQNSWGDMNIKFGEDKETYNRYIYKSDVNFSQDDDSKNLKVYATYIIALRNQSSYLGRINSIIDYCDNRFALVNAGTMIDDETDTFYDELTAPGGKMAYDNNYSKYIINTNMLVYPESSSYLYLKFEVTNYNEDNWRMTLASDKHIEFKNVAEINSYTTFNDYDTNSYLSVVDKDSVPGNAKPGYDDTYEDDTDASRPFITIYENQRSIEGNIFVDSTPEEKQVAKVRLGSGYFEPGEKTVKGVRVELFDNETQQIAKIYNEQDDKFEDAVKEETDDDGYFRFEGYVPGNYVIKYTWGDETYTVQSYKGTTYDKERYDKTSTDPYWYRGKTDLFDDDTISPDSRATDALDSYKIRKEIDTEMANLKYNTIENEIKKAYNSNSNDIRTTKMTSTTPNMEISVEVIKYVTEKRENEGKFNIKNIDFGIVERARQELDLIKRVTKYKITLANNSQTLVEAELDENGNIAGSYPYTINQAPKDDFVGLIKTEMDNEIIQGSTLEIEYTFKVTNVGELDYTTWDYYYFGVIPDDSYLVSVSVSEILDYVDGKLSVVDNKWEIVDDNYLYTVNASERNSSIINEVKPYKTDKLAKQLTPKEPNNTNTVTLQTSKILAPNDNNYFKNISEFTVLDKPYTPDYPRGQNVKVIWENDNKFRFNKDQSQNISIIPSTGQNKNYIIPTIVGITAIVLLGGGIVLIKKFVLDR